ncbi:acetylornithine deacetylase [Phreatobacter oligotrophus]|uniref:acetylornithine deacetylase n=1 Tax=Phreatobacter oligotrophus TaxID=1122261 RepID=UPI00235297E4|nr:acetylornithine deacetylase [Phreatobacter oligotrophus]MBX9990837.1 acetylornithine deacetylase [Phreatobacter oligotrophus]
MATALSTVEVLDRLVSFDTTSRNSNLPLLDWVEDYLKGFGVSGERVYDETGQKANLWVTIGPKDVPGYVLSGHVDVVPVDGQDWSTDPFKLVEKDGRYYGRGTCDMKGFVAASIAAVPAMLAAPLQKPVHLAISYDEEVGCRGVRTLLAVLKDRPLKPEACFVGEPTNMQPVIAHKTGRPMRVTVRGFEAHSSLRPHGVNAIEEAAKLIVKINEIGQRLARRTDLDPLYAVPCSTTSIGVIRGGTVRNIVAGECVVDFDLRCVAGDDPHAIVAEIEAYARDVLEPPMKAIHPGAGFTFEELALVPGLDTAADAPVTLLAKRFAGRNDHAKVAYGTEAGLFQEIGIPSIIVGPGSIEQAHKPDEYVEAVELAKADAFIGKLIAHASGG